MTIPEGLPTLAMGAHLPEEGKACVMELVSVLAGEEWTDRPTCTNRGLTSLAQDINDFMDNEHRRELIIIAPLLVGTAAETVDRDVELSCNVRVLFSNLRAEWNSTQPDTHWSSRKLAAFANARGVETLRELARMCDEFNGYDRSTQEPLKVEQTLAEITR